MQSKTFGFVGSGRVARLLLTRLRSQSALPPKVLASDPEEDARAKVAGIAPECIQAVSENRLAAAADVVFLAIHPPMLETVAQEIKDALEPRAVLVSLLPTVSILGLAQLLNGFDRIVRMIPNAPSLIGRGYNPTCHGKNLLAEDRAFLQSIFACWGMAPEVPEEHLEAYAILTAMGPTYFWFQWLEMKSLAMQFGLTEAAADEALEQMITGAAQTLLRSGYASETVLDLIPAYPLKKQEEDIRKILAERLGSLHQKLVHDRTLRLRDR